MCFITKNTLCMKDSAYSMDCPIVLSKTEKEVSKNFMKEIMKE